VALEPTIRTRDHGDEPAVLDVVRTAFGTGGRSGQDEVDIVVRTWARGASVQPIDLVATDEPGDVVGHVLGAAGHLGDDELLAVAPLAVAPRSQRRGVGSALMTELIRRADEAGWPGIVLLGAPGYYKRFGFEPAGPAGIVYPPVGRENPHFQLRRLAGWRPSLRGDFTYCWEGPASQ
jgi:putative acetyltransferase